MNAAAWLKAHAAELAEFELPSTEVLFGDLAVKTDDGFIDFVDTLVGDINPNDFDLSLWEDDEEEETFEIEEATADDGWDFI